MADVTLKKSFFTSLKWCSYFQYMQMFSFITFPRL